MNLLSFIILVFACIAWVFDIVLCVLREQPLLGILYPCIIGADLFFNNYVILGVILGILLFVIEAWVYCRYDRKNPNIPKNKFNEPN